jgi:hypothetical protein
MVQTVFLLFLVVGSGPRNDHPGEEDCEEAQACEQQAVVAQ